MHGFLLVVAVAVPAVEVTWSGDGLCSRTAFQAQLDAYLASVTLAEPLRARVEAQRDARGRLSLMLTLEGTDGVSTRLLHGASCASVSAAAAFVTAVVVDPTLIDRVPPAEADEAGAAEPAPIPPPAPPSAPPPQIPEAPVATVPGGLFFAAD